MDGETGVVVDYTYDDSGNILSKVTRSWNNNFTSPVLGSVVSNITYSYGDAEWKDLLTSYNGQALTYDAIGNPLSYRDGISFTWQNGRELASYADATQSITYTYDASGLRTGKTVTKNGITDTYEYTYENGMLLKMKCNSMTLEFAYDALGNPVSVAYRSVPTATPIYYYYLLNSRGDVIGLCNSNGSISAKYSYDAYGKLLSVTSGNGASITATYAIANLNPLRYRGYVYDNETGFYYLQSRYYDPTTCRFVNADGYVSTGQGITGNNMYAYCNNSPVSYYDPTGTRIFECCPDGNCPYCKGDNKEIVPPEHIVLIRDVTNEVNEALFSAATENSYKKLYADCIMSPFDVPARLNILVSFALQVNHKAPWDLKKAKSWKETIGTTFPGEDTIIIYNGMKMTTENLGNYTYGYLGKAYGISLPMLYGGSYYAAGFPTSGSKLQNEVGPDWYYITLGYYAVGN